MKRLDKGETLQKDAENYGVDVNTVGDCKKNKQILEWNSALSSLAVDRKTITFTASDGWLSRKIFLNTSQKSGLPCQFIS